MGKLKEKLINDLTPEQIDEQFAAQVEDLENYLLNLKQNKNERKDY